MRIVVARCAVHYVGRGETRLAEAERLILINRAGAVAVYADDRHTPLNWMGAPCHLQVLAPKKRSRKPRHPTAQRWVVSSKRETLTIEIAEVLSDTEHVLAEAEPGLVRSWTEAHLEGWIAGHLDEVFEQPGWTLVGRQVKTTAGPLDLLLRDPVGVPVVVELKRVAAGAGPTDQCLRYISALEDDPALVGLRGLVLALTVKPKAREYAAARGVDWREVPAHLYRA